MKLKDLLKLNDDNCIDIAYGRNTIHVNYWEIKYNEEIKDNELRYYTNGNWSESVPPLPLNAKVKRFYGGINYDECMDEVPMLYIELEEEE